MLGSPQPHHLPQCQRADAGRKKPTGVSLRSSSGRGGDWGLHGSQLRALVLYPQRRRSHRFAAPCLEGPIAESTCDQARGTASLFAPESLCMSNVANFNSSFNILALAGDGALQLAFEQLKNKLQAEGLFDASTKSDAALCRTPRRSDYIGNRCSSA